jgi:hypothetical protein
LALLFRGIYYWVREITKGLDGGERIKSKTVNLESHFKYSWISLSSFTFPDPKFFLPNSYRENWFELLVRGRR